MNRSSLKDARQNNCRLPDVSELDEILALRFGRLTVGDLQSSLFGPLTDLITRPSKKIRSRLVELGYLLATGQKPSLRLRTALDIVELTHAGSLVVDDIQDNSLYRRGQPCLHVKYGTPVALNAGNWLYFWSLWLTRELSLPQSTEFMLLRLFHQNFMIAHCGQAIDIGVDITKVPKHKVRDLCVTSLELKTGVLFSHSLVFGAILGGADSSLQRSLDEFGRGLGIGLQMFNDLGNLRGLAEANKRFEDLINRRPSWVWAHAAGEYSTTCYQNFCRAVELLPDEKELVSWFLENNFFDDAHKTAHEHLERVYNKFEFSLGTKRSEKEPILRELRELGDRIIGAYG